MKKDTCSLTINMTEHRGGRGVGSLWPPVGGMFWSGEQDESDAAFQAISKIPPSESAKRSAAIQSSAQPASDNELVLEAMVFGVPPLREPKTSDCVLLTRLETLMAYNVPS